jgi:hypothetical protein
MPFVEDLAAFFADFAEPATLAGQAVEVIFDEAYDAAMAIGAGGAAGSAPQVQIRTASVPAQPYDAVLAIPGRGSFRVIGHQPDGTGMSVLILQR